MSTTGRTEMSVELCEYCGEAAQWTECIVCRKGFCARCVEDSFEGYRCLRCTDIGSEAQSTAVRNVRDALSYVHRLRQTVTGLKGALGQRKQEFETVNKELIDSIKEQGAKLAEAEDDLRAMGLALYQETGDKKPAPGLGIRIVQHINYVFSDALVWAKKHDMALTLDTKAFEKLAKVQEIPGVLKTETVQVTIATDLEPIVGELQEAKPASSDADLRTAVGLQQHLDAAIQLATDRKRGKVQL